MPLSPERTVFPADVARRWAAARVEEVVLSGKGREAATDVALRAGLLTPWTGWTADRDVYVPTPLATRILDLSSGAEAEYYVDAKRAILLPAGFAALPNDRNFAGVVDTNTVGVFAAVSRSYSFSTAALVGSRTQSSRLSTMIGSMTSRYCGGR